MKVYLLNEEDFDALKDRMRSCRTNYSPDHPDWQEVAECVVKRVDYEVQNWIDGVSNPGRRK